MINSSSKSKGTKIEYTDNRQQIKKHLKKYPLDNTL